MWSRVNDISVDFECGSEDYRIPMSERFSIDTDSGLIEPARQCPSPNCDDRPDGATPELLVVHGISLPPGKYGGPEIDQLFTNCLDPLAHPYFRDVAHLEVSSHLLIRRTGEVVQYVPFRKRAWHAGESCYAGCPACNDFSIGVELEDVDEEAYTPEQYDRLVEVSGALIDAFPELFEVFTRGFPQTGPRGLWVRLKRTGDL